MQILDTQKYVNTFFNIGKGKRKPERLEISVGKKEWDFFLSVLSLV